MSNNVLIIGESGTGKSTSIRMLPYKETFIINVINKPLPFKGASKHYKKLSSDGKSGNYYATDDTATILRVIKLVNEKRPEIKYLIIDDMGYVISNSFMRKALLVGFQKFTELGKDAWEIFRAVNETREDLICFVLMHSDVDQTGKSKPKTIGKLLDEKVCIEGMFTIVLHSIVNDSTYCFITNNNGTHMAKSPLDMFDELMIPNDLSFVADRINAYLNEDDENEIV